MQTKIALLRGINVGGRNKVKMAELKTLLGELGLTEIQTYIQSGNVVFQTEVMDLPQLSEQIKSAIRAQFMFSPTILILTKEQFLEGLKNNPYPEAEDEPKTLHLYFLSAPAIQANIEKLNQLKKDTERFMLTAEVFYLHAPEGIGRSKLAAQAEKALGVPVTARNWRTCLKIKEMVDPLH